VKEIREVGRLLAACSVNFIYLTTLNYYTVATQRHESMYLYFVRLTVHYPLPLAEAASRSFEPSVTDYPVKLRIIPEQTPQPPAVKTSALANQLYLARQ
jgi:hypothetical protein